MNVKRRYFHPRIKAFHKQRAVILIIDFFRAAVHFNIPVEVEHLLIIKLIIIKNRQALVPPVFGVFILQIEVKVKTVKTRTGKFVHLRQRIITCNLCPFHHVIIISERGIQRQINPGRILGIRCLFFAAAQIFQLIDKSFKDNHIPAMVIGVQPFPLLRRKILAKPVLVFIDVLCRIKGAVVLHFEKQIRITSVFQHVAFSVGYLFRIINASQSCLTGIIVRIVGIVVCRHGFHTFQISNAVAADVRIGNKIVKHLFVGAHLSRYFAVNVVFRPAPNVIHHLPILLAGVISGYYAFGIDDVKTFVIGVFKMMRIIVGKHPFLFGNSGLALNSQDVFQTEGSVILPFCGHFFINVRGASGQFRQGKPAKNIMKITI